MRVLGVSAFYHDSAAALIENGEIIAAAQEERFTRRKHDSAFPRHAVAYCLAEAGITLDAVDLVSFYEKPFLKFDRLIDTYLANAPRGFSTFRKAMPLWVRDKLFQKQTLVAELRRLADGVNWQDRLIFPEHHLSHAASAFFASPFDEAVVLTLDGVGEWATTTAGVGQGSKLRLTREIHFPHSLGLLYSAFTYHAGFKVNSGEYKLMGLAPYGEPRYANLIRERLVDIKADGSFRLNLDFFDYPVGWRMTNAAFDELFGLRPRQPSEPLAQVHMDMAASIQSVTNEVVTALARSLHEETGSPNLCMAGGVALNCVSNTHVKRSSGFRRMWIQPAAGDAGGALGAAYVAAHLYAGVARVPSAGGDAMRGAFLGPAFSSDLVARELSDAGARFRMLPSLSEVIDETVTALADERAVGWFQGRMEFGPRALGARSILADPRSPGMQRLLNQKVKFRESFRPFAPAVTREDVAEWFDLDDDSPYMLFVIDVAAQRLVPPDADGAAQGLARLHVPRSTIPAVTHVDGSARVQTVHRETNPAFHALLTAFKRRTGCPVLVNTSFNVRGEPIVHSPADAFRCFMGTDIEMLVVENCIMMKADQDPSLRADHHGRFAPD